MKISVIVPTYNRALLLSQCLANLVLLNYPYCDYELIIVDNNSCDNTNEIVDKYIHNYPDLRIKYVFEGQQGLVFARHSGAKVAKYDILAFIDDDGLACKDWLLEIKKVFECNPDIGAAAGKIVIKWDTIPPNWIHKYEPYLGKIDLGDNISYSFDYPINGGNYIIRKDLLFQVGGFNPDQIGDYLIGDGEYGLNNKLYKKGILIGWSPKAIVEHQQFVEKNARITDIGRRYFNNGRTIVYNLVREKFSKKILFKHFLKSLLLLSKNILLLVLYSLNKDFKNEIYLILYHQYAQVEFSFRLIFKKNLRIFINKNGI